MIMNFNIETTVNKKFRFTYEYKNYEIFESKKMLDEIEINYSNICY